MKNSILVGYGNKIDEVVKKLHRLLKTYKLCNFFRRLTDEYLRLEYNERNKYYEGGNL